MIDDATRAQIAAQCKAIKYMATALARVHADYQKIFELSPCPAAEIADSVGQRSAAYMERLGDMLNAMDACAEEEDDWLDPVFVEAQRRWPVSPSR
jgi:hypothetical protein